MPVQLSVDQRQLQALGRALKAEADGKALRRELARNLRDAAKPAMAEARSNLMGITTLGGKAESPPLRTTILREMRASARLSGRSTGARVRVRKRGPRGFAFAARRLNRPKGWRHPVFGTDTWVHQVASPPGWFDRAMQAHRREYRKAAIKAMNDMAIRLSKRGVKV